MAKERCVGSSEYAPLFWASPWVFANFPYQRQKADMDIEIHGTHRILRTPTGYFLHHMGNNGLHNLDVVHTIPVPCYAQIKQKRMLKMSSESLFCLCLPWGPNSHPPSRLLWLWCVCSFFFFYRWNVKSSVWSTLANTQTGFPYGANVDKEEDCKSVWKNHYCL